MRQSKGFEMRYRALLLGLGILLLSACGGGVDGNYGTGGGGGGGSTAAVQGVWYGTYSIKGTSGSKPIIAVIAQDGYAFFYDADGNVYVLPKLTGSKTVTGTLDAYAAFGGAFPDGHTHDSFALTGTASDTSIKADFTGNGESGSLSLAPLATNATGISGIADLAGNLGGFYFGSGSPAAVALTVQSSGVFAGADANGCNLVGTFTKLQAVPFIVVVTVKSSGSSGACAGTMNGLGFVTDQDIGKLFGGTAGNYLYLGVSNSQAAFAAELKLP